MNSRQNLCTVQKCNRLFSIFMIWKAFLPKGSFLIHPEAFRRNDECIRNHRPVGLCFLLYAQRFNKLQIGDQFLDRKWARSKNLPGCYNKWGNKTMGLGESYFFSQEPTLRTTTLRHSVSQQAVVELTSSCLFAFITPLHVFRGGQLVEHGCNL